MLSHKIKKILVSSAFCFFSSASMGSDVRSQGAAPPLISAPIASCAGPGGDNGVRSQRIGADVFFYCDQGFTPSGFTLQNNVGYPGLPFTPMACDGGCPVGAESIYVVTCCFGGAISP